MAAKIKVIRFADDNLSGETWDFYYQADAHTLWVDFYAQLSRPTKRHKVRVMRAYSRLASHSEISIDDVPLPDDVVQEAREQFFSSLVVGRRPKREPFKPRSAA